MIHRKPASPIFLAIPTLFSLVGLVSAQSVVAPGPDTYGSATSETGASSSPVTTVDIASPHVITYPVVKGDSLTKIAKKFNTTRRKLESLNQLGSSKIMPGEILVVGTAKHARPKSSLAGAGSQAKPSHHYLMAQPVQDFDVPASTFASCPVPLPADNDVAEPVPAPASEASETPSPRAEVAADLPAPEPPAPPTPEPPVAQPGMTGTPEYSFATPAPEPAPAPPPARPANHSFFSFFHTTPPAPDWGTRFTQVARQLGDQGLVYDADWCPPGESHAWTMDCSNTTRYLYKAAAGIELPRTASDQYYYLHLQDKAWDVPTTSTGFADCNYLRQNLKPGDLLFWENTYRPERQPPITHVMVYLGTNARGNWIMAGSQTGPGGEHNRRDGGPDIYVFNPTRPCGGYTTWLGLVHHQGRFCAFGRPLEADKSKLAMAAND
jgi:cell wall-associated NlpC family hydrolase